MKRTIISFDPEVHAVLRLRSLQSNRSVSDLVDEAVRLMLAEDLEDVNAIADREEEPTIPLESLVQRLKELGKL
ncbi:MAG: hypothetical protein SH809_13485 [Rhodothermales bacterium]|nr:hypothetical protein [Rhodothermales bacterium]